MSKLKNAVVTASIVRELLCYDPHDGSFVWKERRQEWFKSERSCKAWNSKLAGKPAGYINTQRDGHCYLKISIFGKQYYACQLAWLWMYGEWPNGYLVHADGNSLNLRIDNILSDMVGKGMRIHSNNRSGITGVSWDKKCKRWRAQANVKGEQHYLGLYRDFSEAEAVVEEWYREHGFLDRHGKELPLDAA